MSKKKLAVVASIGMCAALAFGSTYARAADMPSPAVSMAALVLDPEGTALGAVCAGSLDRSAAIKEAKNRVGAPTPVLAPSLSPGDGPIVLTFFDVSGHPVTIDAAGLQSVRFYHNGEAQPAYEGPANVFAAGACVPIPDKGTLGNLVSDQRNDTYRIEVSFKTGITGKLGPAFFRTVDRLAGTRFEARVVGKEPCEKFDRTQFVDSRFPQYIASSSPIDAPRIVGADQVIHVAFFDNKGRPLNVREATVDTVKLFRGEASDPVYAVSAAAFEETSCIPIPAEGTLEKLLKDKDGTLYRLEVVFKDGSALQLKPKYLRRANLWQAYGWDPFDLDTLGFWMPVGLFGTNLKSTANGIEFVAVPIGVALGGKWWLRDNLFIGFSGIGSWTIARTASGSSDGGMQSEKTTAKNLGFGGLIDVGGFAYLGGIYVADLSSAHDHPGLMFLAGLGPATIKAIADGSLRF